MAYIGIGQEEGMVVEEDKAYEYALYRSLSGTEEDKKDFREMLVEWFYSGDWIRRES